MVQSSKCYHPYTYTNKITNYSRHPINRLHRERGGAGALESTIISLLNVTVT